MWKKIRQVIFITVTAFILVLPALKTNVKRNQISTMDNRQLSEFPELKMGGFRSSLENYLSDRIGFREELITFYQVFCDKAFHVLEHPLYVYGKEGHIMTMWDLVTYQHQDVSAKYVDNLTEYLKSLNDFCKKQGSEFLFYLCPNKETIYPEFCPDGYRVNDQPNRSERILEKLKGNEVPFLYPKDMFLELKNTEQIYNKKYDAGHWNMKGSFYGQREVLKYFNKTFPQMKKLEENEFVVSTNQMDYLHNSRFRIDEQTPVYKIKETSAIEDPGIFEKLVLADSDMFHYHYKSNNPADADKPRVLIYGDSYFQTAAPFYLNHCSELLLLHSHNMVYTDYCISVYQPDIVIFEAVERVLQKEGFIDDTRVSRRFYTLEDYERQQYKKEELAIEENCFVFDKKSWNDEYVKFEGNVGNEMGDKQTQIVMVAAVVNEKEYFSIFNQSSGSFQFTFRKEDLLDDQDITFYKIYSEKF